MPIVTFLRGVEGNLRRRREGLHLPAQRVRRRLVVGALLVAATGHVPKKGRLALMLQLAFATLLVPLRCRVTSRQPFDRLRRRVLHRRA